MLQVRKRGNHPPFMNKERLIAGPQDPLQNLKVGFLDLLQSSKVGPS